MILFKCFLTILSVKGIYFPCLKIENIILKDHLAFKAVTGHNEDSGNEGTHILSTLPISWLVLDHLTKIMAESWP